MLRRLALVVIALLMLVPSAPAQADPLRPDYGHWGQDCPYGLTVRLGGGSGWRHYMRRAIDGWNIYVAPNYWAAPRITNVVDVAWDAQVQYRRCTIDMDEQYDNPGWGWANSIPFPDNHHYAGGVVVLETVAWHETGRYANAHFLRDSIAAHELQHTMGLGHNPYCDSVMAQGCYQTLGHNWRDVDTLNILYRHKH